ncbi:hypothetical protein MBM_02671 [Drepanopeziza brunnea f. sp. 'multigermtubi' MB_m1]|uniref:Uncharacterized protein n=1 Tax=Marssonina brunnea f. sp. multigermtubi (strain MB_m1) TaxID=1072389 RepID=K1Y2P0_MARBU|nr:uncharacterized protein MBM_02671 [Drepanopeziza brunnea f. sp. 'multigermtubi' MB_m1]EKD19434.1 hypothetical protein MBM_02671 [Drepanopeziza brunnea f. sp. 'multigermtubi' MB_m1]
MQFGHTSTDLPAPKPAMTLHESESIPFAALSEKSPPRPDVGAPQEAAPHPQKDPGWSSQGWIKARRAPQAQESSRKRVTTVRHQNLVLLYCITR